MSYLIATYWPFMAVALLGGVAVGWLYRRPEAVDDMAAWLEDGPDER